MHDDETPLVLPELTDGKQWQVKVAKGMAGKTAPQMHVMEVPADNDWLGGAVRMHEMAHAKWTTRVKNDEEADAQGHAKNKAMELLIQSCEDRRIHSLLAESVTDWDEYAEAMLDYTNEFELPDDAPAVLQVALELASRQHHGEQVKKLPRKLRKIVDQVEDLIVEKNEDNHICWEAAKLIRKALKLIDEDEGMFDYEDFRSGSGDEDDDDDDFDDFDDFDDDGDDIDRGDVFKAVPGWLPKGIKPKKPIIRKLPKDSGGDKWCKMTTDRPNLDDMIPRQEVVGRGKRSDSAGVVPRNLYRMYSGGRIFTRKAKGKKIGGTILIDVSGSMSITPGQIIEMMKEIRQGTVAIYSSDGSKEGFLTVVARHYRRVKDLARWVNRGGGNGVDGPALRWLAKQPEPRAWICDGRTTGIGDMEYGRQECADLEKAHRIVRYNNIEDYLEDRKAVGPYYGRW